MKNLVLPLSIALSAAAATAQCFEPNFGTPLGTAATLIGDIVLPIQPIGFAFPLGGTNYTDLHICDKGYVWLSNGGTPVPGAADFSATLGELASQGPRIAALWSDLQVLATNNGQIYLNSSATRSVVTWENIACYQGNCGVFTMQLQMMASGDIYFFWGPGATNNSTTIAAWQVGVCGVSPGGAAAPASVDLSVVGVTTNPVLGEEWLTANTFDLAGGAMHFVPAGTGWVYAPPTGCATAARYGTGCVQGVDSFYEVFGTFDLANTTLTWLRTGPGYSVLTGLPGTFVAPSATAVNIAPSQLDGSQVVTLSAPMPVPGGTTTSLCVTTKGQVIVTAVQPTAIDWTPTAAELLNYPDTQFSVWHDFDQTSVGSGLILYEEVGGIAYVTWNGVYSLSATLPSTFQFQFDIATGSVTLVFGTNGGIGAPDQGIVGFSVGGASLDPGATDLSALSGVLALADSGVSGLTLAATGLPVLGNAGFSMVTSNVPPVAPVAVQLFGSSVVNPGLDLTFLGMPGCFGYTNADLTSAVFPVAPATSSGSVTLPIPNTPGLIGLVLSTQSIAFSTATAFGLVASNGLRLELGL